MSSRKQESTRKLSKPTAKKKPIDDDLDKPSTSRATKAGTKSVQRIVRTQYFPNKQQIYHNAVKAAKESDAKKKSTPATKPQPKPELIKRSNNQPIIKQPPKVDLSHLGTLKRVVEVERPRTATLRKGSIVNTNIAGPDVPLVTSPTSPTYSDDFDSYASDFDDYQSSSSMSSSPIAEDSSSSPEDDNDDNIDETAKVLSDDEKKLDSGNFELSENKQHVQLLDDIKEIAAMESLSDEGFEESMQFVNFVDAKRRQTAKNNSKSRGRELLNMIKLDLQSFTLFELPAISYDEFIVNFGKKNAQQVAVQTQEGVDDETQCDVIVTINKWTQNPPKFDKSYTRADLLGVGDDCNNNIEHQPVDYDEYRLKKFLQSAGEAMCGLMAENARCVLKNVDVDEKPLPFCDGYVMFDTKFLTGRDVIAVCFSKSKILTLHAPNELDLKSYGCLWLIGDHEKPIDLFTTYGEATCCTFASDDDKVIVAGMHDGTITLWDSHNMRYKSSLQTINSMIVKIASYTTCLDYDFSNKIVGIESVSDVSRDDNVVNLNDKSSTSTNTQVISLDELGNLIIWGVIVKQEDRSLVRNTIISLSQLNPELDGVLICTDLCINRNEPNHFYIATKHGVILHCLASGTKTNPRKFSNTIAQHVSALRASPHTQHFLAGCDNGNVLLYSRHVEKPLLVLSSQDNSDATIEMIEWSLHHPGMFYTKDSADYIHVWNLFHSELLPQHSIHIRDGVRLIKLSINELNKAFMVIVTDSGVIYLHQLNEAHTQSDQSEFNNELETFRKYVNRL